MSTSTSEALAVQFVMEERHVALVHQILQKVIPDRTVWAFGSRATGRYLKRFSDLDLAVEGRLTWRERSTLAEDFDDSALPIKVDIVELDMVDEDFRERIKRDFVLVQSAATMPPEVRCGLPQVE